MGLGRVAPFKMAAAGLGPARPLLARRPGALRALLGLARGLAAGPQTHFGFQNVSEEERREKSEGAGGSLRRGPGGAGRGSRCASVVGVKGLPEAWWGRELALRRYREPR